MHQPSIDVLMEKMESKYALVVAAAKRARSLTDGAKVMIAYDKDILKPASIALKEIATDKIVCQFPKGGIK